MISMVSGKAQAESWTGAASIATGATTLLANKWYHIAYTWNSAGGLRLYVNGALDASTAQANFSASGSGDYITIASPLSGTTCGSVTSTAFAGSVDDVRIYNRALSAQEISALYALGR